MHLTQKQVSDLKNIIAHNIAQRMVINTRDSREYIEYCQSVLKAQLNEQQAKEIYEDALDKAIEEVDVIRDIYDRYGIEVNVSGNGGSQVSLETIIEMTRTQ